MAQRTLPITGLTVGHIPADVIVCGDPGRAATIAAHLERAQLLSEQRGYHVYRGHYREFPVAVCSHGVGAPGAAVAFEELIAAGARRIIRVGTCGGLQAELEAGHLVIATAAVQHTGYGQELAPEGYPAVADLRLTLSLEQAAAALDYTTTTGLVLTRDLFYGGVPATRVPDYRALSDARVLAVEMECAALFLIGSLRSVQTGAILAVDGNVLSAPESMEGYQPHRPVVAAAVEAEISIALEALRRLRQEGA